MAALPIISGRQAVRAFQRLGWAAARQSGSHVIMTKTGEMVTLSVPDHATLAKGTLRSLIRLAGITVEQFVAALE